MEKFTDEKLFYQISSSNYELIFTTSNAGNMAYQAVGDNVLENRKQVATSIGRDINKFVFMQQTHSDNITEVSNKDWGKGLFSFEDGITNTDCLYTFEDDIVLCGFYADCTPVYITCADTNLSCIIHAGWQGTVKAITYKAIEHFKQLGMNVENLKVIIGPSISQNNFEVEEDVIKLVNDLKMINNNECYTQVDEVKYKLNVKKLNELQLIASGVLQENITVSEICTFEQENLFSYRLNNNTGRMMGCIYKK